MHHIATWILRGISTLIVRSYHSPYRLFEACDAIALLWDHNVENY